MFALARLSAVLLGMLTVLSGCCTCKKRSCPDLVVTATGFDPVARTVTATVKNVGDAPAGAFLVYIEINRTTAPASAKPESQLSVSVAGLAAGAEHVVAAAPLTSFSARNTIDLATITSFQLVVNADAKVQVAECNESNNVHTTTF